MQTYDLVDHIRRHTAWSQKTFGPGDRARGIIAHIRKELLEIEADPKDLMEWIDHITLGIDGAANQGYTAEQIADALRFKLAVNERRTWPDWRQASPDQPVEHIR